MKTCMYYPDNMISFENIHKMNNRAMPNALMLYKLAIQLFKIYNATEFTLDWTILNFNQIFTSRQNSFMMLKSNEKKVGINVLANRLSILNGKIPLSWLNCSLPSYKMHCKKLFLSSNVIKLNSIIWQEPTMGWHFKPLTTLISNECALCSIIWVANKFLFHHHHQKLAFPHIWCQRTYITDSLYEKKCNCKQWSRFGSSICSIKGTS